MPKVKNSCSTTSGSVVFTDLSENGVADTWVLGAVGEGELLLPPREVMP